MVNLFKKSKEPSQYVHPDVYEHLNSVIILNTNGYVLSLNGIFTEQYGYEASDFDKPFFDVFIQNETLEQKQFFEKAILGKKQFFNALGRCKNGKLKDILIKLIPIENKTGIDIYVIIEQILVKTAIGKKLLLSQKKQNIFNKLEDVFEFYYDAINDYFYLSKQSAPILGVDAGDDFKLTLKKMLQFVHPDDANKVKTTIENALKNKTGYQMQYRIVQKDKTIRYLYGRSEILLDNSGNLEGLVGYTQDITNSKIAKEVLVKEENLFKLYDNPDVGIWTLDCQTKEYLNVSNGVKQITGYTNEDFNNGLQWSLLVHPDDLLQYAENQHKLQAGLTLKYQYRIINKNGDVRWVQDYTVPTLDEDGKLIQLNVLTSDITEQKTLQEQLKDLSEIDSLTKLPNRQKFYEQLQKLINKYKSINQQFAIIILDIDRFKYINDTLGHPVGDQLLSQIANRLATQLTGNDILARHGGDEFSIFKAKVESIDSLKTFAHKIKNCLSEPFYIENYQLYVTASAGISVYPENGRNSVELFRNADLALHKSQVNGKNDFEIISKSSSIQSYKSFTIGRDLKKALENNEMILYYQPRVDARTNQIVSAEALIRWNHPEWGMILPNEFLAIAEENRLIKDVDDWVLKEACNQIKKWKENGIQTVPISINISAVHFSIYNWSNIVRKVIHDAGISAQDLEFEITETLLLSNTDVIKETISSLKKMGIKLSLNGFGIGYSSLSYLTQFPFDMVKIDKSFIRNMFQSEHDLFIVKSIIYMTKGLNIKAVAEGVETTKQLHMLLKEQCHEVQGYLYSPPVTADELKKLLAVKTLTPLDLKLKARQSRRNFNRIRFPHPLEADMRLLSIGDRKLHLGKANILIEDMSIGGLRYISTLNLPVREDLLFEFDTQILGKSIKLLGTVIWKEEIYEELLEYGIEFIINRDERNTLEALLNSFEIFLKNGNTPPSSKILRGDKLQYFKKLT